MDEPTVITVFPHDEIVHVAVTKSALSDPAANALEVEVTYAANAAPGLPVVIDMAKVKFVPSVALGALITLRNGLNLEGRPLILVGVQRQVRDTIKVTRLDQMLKIYNTVDEALESVRRPE